MKKLFLFLTLLVSSASVSAASVENIEVLDTQHIDITFSSDVALELWQALDADIQVFKDVEISYANRDLVDYNQAIISLHEDILPGSNYSLIGIFGADGTIDFTTGETVSGYEATWNPSDTSGIFRLEILDPKTINVFFHTPLDQENLEFKLLNNVLFDAPQIAEINNISLSLRHELQSASSYILLILSLSDISGIVFLDEELYDFSTPLDLTAPWSKPTLAEIIQENEIVEAEEEIIDIALNAAETPDTGASTWVLLLLTIIANIAFYITKKQK